MSIKINYLKKTYNKTSANLVLFTDEKYKINGLKKYLSNSEFSYINDLLKTNDLKKNLLIFEVNSNASLKLSKRNSRTNFCFPSWDFLVHRGINNNKSLALSADTGGDEASGLSQDILCNSISIKILLTVYLKTCTLFWLQSKNFLHLCLLSELAHSLSGLLIFLISLRIRFQFFFQTNVD